MKAILATALILALGITGVSLLVAVHAQRMVVSSSQIYIDGTPVCVIRQGGEISASVGRCGNPPPELPEGNFGSGGVFHEGVPFPPDPRLGLPPGHPPIDSSPEREGGRGIAI